MGLWQLPISVVLGLESVKTILSDAALSRMTCPVLIILWYLLFVGLGQIVNHCSEMLLLLHLLLARSRTGFLGCLLVGYLVVCVKIAMGLPFS